MKKIVVLLTSCLLAICTIVSVAAQTTERASGYSDLDYATSANKVTLQMGDVLSRLGGFTVSEAEKDYIRFHFDGQCALYYTRPDAYVDNEYTVYDAETDRLELVVQDDFHENQHNYLIWVPVKATIGDMSAEFAPADDIEQAYYRAVFEDIEWAASMDVSIEYRADLVLSSQTLNDFINFAYDGAVRLDSDKQAYEQALAAYEQSVIEWNQYKEDKARYDDYLDQVALYQDYLAFLAYSAAMDAYYQAYEAYLVNEQEWKDYQINDAKYRAYVTYRDRDYPDMLAKYQQDMEVMNHQLQLLSYLEKQDPKAGVSFVEMMIDDRVAQKIAEYRDVITVIPGVKGSTIDQITASTEYLKVFCLTYSSLDTDQAKYRYYIQEHKNFAMHLKKLYDSTQELYKIDQVYSTLLKLYPQYVDRMVVMLGSLYVQDCVFNDKLNLNLNEVVDHRGKLTAAKLVDASVRPEKDTNQATPLNAVPEMPRDPESYEVKVQPVEPAQKLTKPVEPEKPVYVVIKNEAELESNMQDPGHMDPPVEPAPELTNPDKLSWDQYEQALYEAFVAETLSQRPYFEEDQTFSLTASVDTTVYLDTVDIRYYVYFFNTDENNTPLGRSDGVHEGESATVPASAKNPTKAADARYTYEFIGWVDANENPVDLTNITRDINVYASYRAIPRTYRVTWIVEGVSVEQELEYGQTPTYAGTPQKDATAQYSFTFNGWDKPVVPVTADVTYIAQFEATENRYKVTFIMGDGVPIEKEYKYGWSLIDAVNSIPTPFIEPTAQYTYSFKGWRDAKGNFYSDKNQLPTLTENMTFTAEFDQTVNKYNVTWMVDGVATQVQLEYGEMPTFTGTPNKATDEWYHYTFAGWDQEIVSVTQDAVYVAKFDKQTRYYRITFVIEGKEYPFSLSYDEMPDFGEIPHKESDAQYKYTFMGWDIELAPVREDAVYTARFFAELRQYSVTFIVGDKQYTSDFAYGTVPEYKGDKPTKPDDMENYYVFAGWDKEIVAVDGSEAIYTAVFDAFPLIPEDDGVTGELTVGQDGGYQLKVEGTQVDLSLIFDKAGRDQVASLEVFFGDASIKFSKAQIDTFYLMGESIAEMRLTQITHQGCVAYQIEMNDSEGLPTTYLITEFAVKLPYRSENSLEVFRVEADGRLTPVKVLSKDGYLEFSTLDLATYVIMEKYTIEKMPAENGTFEVIGEAYAQDVITITPDAKEGYLVDTVTVTCNGEQVKVEMIDGVYTFVMPEGNVQVSVTFAVVEGGSGVEVIVGVVTAALIVVVGLAIAIIIYRKKSAKA